MNQPILSDRYKILKSIGRGGMAEVYLARDLILERDVALKQLLIDKQNDEESIQRFKREAESTAELMHPHIVSIYDVQDEPYPFIVMEHVNGTDLKKYLKVNAPLKKEKALEIMDQILSAIDHAHQKNIIHRDIKPQNILINENDQIKVTDFGIAVVLSQDSITRTNSMLGTVHYISPEQARGSVVTKQSDIYSLGVLLYELLCGEVPYNGESAVSIAIKHIQEDLPELESPIEKLPQSLKNVVLKATDKKPSNRYQSVDEMRKDLKTSLNSERLNEAVYAPVDDSHDQTKVITPIQRNNLEAKENQKTLNQPSPKVDKSKDQTLAYQDSEKQKRKTPIWLLILIPLILLAFIALGVYGSTLTNEPIQVPDFNGLTQKEAQLRIQEMDLVVGDIIEESSSEVPDGLVIGSNPEAGSTINENSEVDLLVSTGEERFTIEDYKEKDYEDVQRKLSELGFTVNRLEISSDDIEPGQIVSQSISPGQEVIPKQTTIELSVSTEPQGTKLKDLTNYSKAQLEDYAKKFNLNLNINEESSDSIPDGQVIRQRPEPGTRVYENDTLSVDYSTGPESKPLVSISHQITVPYQPSVSTSQSLTNQIALENTEQDESQDNGWPSIDEDTSQDPEPNHIQVYIDDAETDMNRPVHDFEIVHDTQLVLNFVVEEGDTAYYRIVRDGEIISEEEVSS